MSYGLTIRMNVWSYGLPFYMLHTELNTVNNKNQTHCRQHSGGGEDTHEGGEETRGENMD